MMLMICLDWEKLKKSHSFDGGCIFARLEF